MRHEAVHSPTRGIVANLLLLCCQLPHLFNGEQYGRQGNQQRAAVVATGLLCLVPSDASPASGQSCTQSMSGLGDALLAL